MYGQVVRRARVGRGLTQADLSAISGIDQPNISAIENGRRRPSADTLHRLLAACGFELLATAGDRVLALPAPEDDVTHERQPVAVIPMADRVRMVTAALDASEAIVRNR